MAWMLYGANGYTGRLTAELAVQRGHAPILAGRNEAALSEMGASLGLQTRIFSLDDSESVKRGLEGITAVLHQAGPFSATSRPMVDGCLAAGAHYLDITGEMGVFSRVLKRDAEAKEAGVVLMSGVGFDVVPTDCLAALLHAELPSATHLDLAIGGLVGGPSAGTMKTMVEGLPHGSAVRREGRVKPIGSGSLGRFIPFPRRQRHAMAIPWGDLVTAFHTTGIPNITTYMAIRPSALKWVRLVDRNRWLTRQSWMQAAMKRAVEWRITGPDAEARETGRSEVWGEVRDDNGRAVSGWVTAPEAYSLTADASLRAVLKIVEGGVAPGATTPARGLGADFVRELDGVTLSVGEARAAD